MARCACLAKKLVNNRSSGIISGTTNRSCLIPSSSGCASLTSLNKSLMWTKPMGLSKYPLQSGKRVWREVFAFWRLVSKGFVDVEVNHLAARSHDVADYPPTQV